MNDERLIELETRLAFQESTIQQLNDIVTSQQEKIEILQAAIQELHKQIKSLSEPAVRDLSEEPPPPHY